MFSFSKLWILWLRSWTDFSIVWPKPNDALPGLWDFRWLSLLFLPSPEQGNTLCLHPLLSSKRSVAAEDSEEPVLAGAKKEECFPASGGVFRVLCLFLGVFYGKITDVFFLNFVHRFASCQNWIIFPKILASLMFVATQQKHLFWAKWRLYGCPGTLIFSERKTIAIMTF